MEQNGWDEPSINSLILATFVGSYMLSNQMRGRAIRVNSNPHKTANIWHLVCVCDNINGDSSIENADLNLLKRRFESFTGIGIHNVDDRIHLIYGQKYGVSIQSNLGNGTRIIITIPAIPYQPPEIDTKNTADAPKE